MADKTVRRKELSPQQKADSARLRQLWSRITPMTQKKFGETYDMGGQGNVTQYLNGIIPVNLEAAIKFAHALNVSVSAISPTLGKVAAYVRPHDADPLLEGLVRLYKALDDDGRDELIARANRIYSNQHPDDRVANPYPDAQGPKAPETPPSAAAKRIPRP